MKTLIAAIVVLISGSVLAQPTLEPLKYNRQQESEMNKRTERLHLISKNYRDGSMELPFIDDFSTDKFAGNEEGNPTHWLDFYTFRNYTYGMNPPTLGVVTFDGADEFGIPYNWNASGNAGVPADTLTAVPINLNYPASDNIYFSFFYQGKGYGETPETGDSLIVEFYAPNLDQWFHAWSVPGSAMTEFVQVFIPITQERYLMDNFQFRFVNYATPKGVLDHWHIDYVQLDRNRSSNEIIDDVAYRYPAQTLLKNHTSVPWKHFRQNPTNFMASQVDLLAFNNNVSQGGNPGTRTVLNRNTAIYHEGVLMDEYNNESSPPIFAQTELILTESIYSGDFNFVYPTDVNDTAAVFDVYFSHEVSPDFIQTNNELHLKQAFYSHYAYDDGSPEAALTFPLAGHSAALQYVNSMADSLIGVAIWFEALNKIPANGNMSFFPNVWSGNENGPGDLIAQGPWSTIPFTAGEPYGWRLFTFEQPVFISPGIFYVGFNQTTNDKLHTGVDMNTNRNTDYMYYMNPLDGYWQASMLPGTLMVRPVFKSDKLGPLSVEKTPEVEVIIYPNPANDELFISASGGTIRGKAEIINLTGQVLLVENMVEAGSVSVGTLSPGIYMLRFTSSENEVSVRKFVKK